MQSSGTGASVLTQSGDCEPNLSAVWSLQKAGSQFLTSRVLLCRLSQVSINSLNV